MAIQVKSKPGVEAYTMSVPKVEQVKWNDETYYFNGWVGNHENSGTVFEFQNALESRRIWVDVNGSFICEG
ncbi:hypothetical protein D3C80_659940 [compost metagenome]